MVGVPAADRKIGTNARGRRQMRVMTAAPFQDEILWVQRAPTTGPTKERAPEIFSEANSRHRVGRMGSESRKKTNKQTNKKGIKHKINHSKAHLRRNVKLLMQTLGSRGGVYRPEHHTKDER